MFIKEFPFKFASYILILLALSIVSHADKIIYADDKEAGTKYFGLIMPQENITVTASGQLDDTQSPINTINGSGINSRNQHSTDYQTMWLSSPVDEPNRAWIRYDFDKLYKLPCMLVWNYNVSGIAGGFGIKGVSIEYSADSGQTWTVLHDVNEFPIGLGTDDYEPAIVEFDEAVNGIAANAIRITALSNWYSIFNMSGLSEVKFYYLPVWPANPVPADNTLEIVCNTALKWTPGKCAAEHKVYFGTDELAVINGTAPYSIVTDANWTPPELVLGTIYFWRIEEINLADNPSVWSGKTWTFSVQDYRVVDNFESYTEAIPSSKWSCVSGTLASIEPVDTPKVNGGRQSMKFFFDNRIPSGFSEISSDPGNLSSGRNWLTGSPKWLVLWIYGDTANPTTEKLYVQINSANYYFNSWYILPNFEIVKPWWTQVAIPLQSDAVNLRDVTILDIGLYRDGDTAGSGFIYIDDIRLYNTLPESAEPANPGDANLVAFYRMQNDTSDSSRYGHNGTTAGTTFVTSCKPEYGAALAFDGSDDYVDLGSAMPFNFTGSFSISFWVKIQDWATDWSHTIAATRGEGMGFAVRKGSYWAGIFQGVDPNGLAFTTRGIGLKTGFLNPENMMAAAPKLNTWTHIVCVYDKAKNVKKIYYDGKLIREAVTLPNTSLTPSTAKASLGARANAYGTGFEKLFSGVLDEVRFYNKALSVGEVRFLAEPIP